MKLLSWLIFVPLLILWFPVSLFGMALVAWTAPTGSEYIAVSAGHRHTCAIDATGSIYCWGIDQFGAVFDAP